MEERRGADIFGLLRLLVGEVALFALFYFSAPVLGSVALNHFQSWIRQNSVQDAFTGLVRLGCLVVSGWLLLTTFVYLVGSLTGVRPLVRGSGWATLPFVRRVVDGMAAASILAATVTASGGTISSAPVRQVVHTRTIQMPKIDGGDLHRVPKSPVLTPTAAVSRVVVGRHLPHPGIGRHELPVLAAAFVDSGAPSPENGFSGLSAGTKVVVVQAGDCLSILAERHLGNWQQYHQIAELNVGRVQPDGHALQDAHWIYPGWVLVMPVDAAGVQVVGAQTPMPVSGSPVQAPPATAATAATAPTPSQFPVPAPVPPPSPAEATPAPRPAATGPVPSPPASSPRTAPQSRASAGGEAPTGDALPAGSAADRSPTTSAPAAAAPPPTMVAMAADSRAPNGRLDVAALAEAGLVAAAVLTTIQVLRRRQARQRPSGRRIRLPGPEAVAAELALGRVETPDRVPMVERALAAFVASVGHAGATAPTVLGVLVDDESVELLLAQPAPPPAPWTATSEGFRWHIPALVLPVAAVNPQQSAPLPALTPVGRVAAGRADALINLEAAGLVSVTGDPARAARLLYAMAIHLIAAPWAQAVNLIVVGLPPGLATSDHVRSVAALSDVTEELESTARVMAATVKQHGCRDAVAGRLKGWAGDGWPPVVVISAQRPRAHELQMLAEVTQPGRGVAAVIFDAGELARWEIDASAQPCPVNPLRLAVEPTVLDPQTVISIEQLITAADDTSGACLSDPPYDRVEVSVENPPPAATSNVAAVAAFPETNGASHPPPSAPAGPSLLEHLDEPKGRPANGARHRDTEPIPELIDSAIMVRVLGSVEVDGASEFKRAKSRELIVYLAMHPNCVGDAELDEALWGSGGARVVASSTRDATVSVARTALGGAARLLPAQGQGREKRYQLGPDVQSDWRQFCALHRFGREHQSAEALRRALALVRGRPFEAVVSGRTYGWIHTEGHVRHIEAEVADAADLAAGFYLEAGDPLAARWAARCGLLAEPYTERLWVRLMEAADALGESQEIERIMDEMDVILELEGDFTGLHPNTLATYDRLSRRHRFPVDR